MSGFNKLLISKLIALVVIVTFSVTSTAYGIDLSEKRHLRKPLLFNDSVSGDELRRPEEAKNEVAAELSKPAKKGKLLAKLKRKTELAIALGLSIVIVGGIIYEVSRPRLDKSKSELKTNSIVFSQDEEIVEELGKDSLTAEILNSSVTPPEHSLVLSGDLKPFSAKPRTPGEALPGLYGNAGIVGGIGTGSISRTRDGRMANFTFSACPVLETLPQGQTSIYIKKGNKVYTMPLGVKLEGDSRLSTWDWSAAKRVAKSATYVQSYPFSFWQYPISEDLPVSVTIRRFSPFIPGDLTASTEPVAISEITITNPSDEDIEISVMISRPNIVGYELIENPDNKESYIFSKSSEGQEHTLRETSERLGIVLDADNEKDPRLKGQTALVTDKQKGIKVTYVTAFSAEKGEKVWQSFSSRGELPSSKAKTSDGKEQAGAIAVKLKLKPGEIKTIPFAFAWDFPIDVRNGKQFHRYHTRRYGPEGDDAFKIASRALQNRGQWSVKISEWQKKILRNPNIPSEVKTMLINELYFLVQAGSLLTSQREPYFLESIVYRIHNTLDVWFYTPMLAAVFPELEKELIRMHSKLVPVTDNSEVDYFNIYHPEYGFSGDERLARAFKARKEFDITQRYPGPLKPKQGVVHHVDDIIFGPIVDNPDLGGGIKTNGNRRWQNHNPWKDLNPKFALMAWRAFIMDGSKDIDFLREVWPSIKIALERQKEFDKDGDGLPEHEGYPDQTYDTWSITGPGIMTADLTMASLRTAIEIAQLVGEHQLANDYRAWLDQAAESTEKKLWNGEYFNVSEQDKDIMADAFPGTLYLQLFGLEPVISPDKIKAHLSKVYDFNFRKFADGKVGVINAMTPEGKSIGELGGDIQRDEVWLGTQRSVAALMMFYDMQKQAWEILGVDYANTWNGEYANMIPEAIDVKGNWRSLVYMRAGAIYNVLLALSNITNLDGKVAETPKPLKSYTKKTFDVEASYKRFKSQINPKRRLVNSFVGLPKGYPSHGVTWMYNQAQAGQICLSYGDIETAELLARATLKLKKNGKGWYNAYITSSGRVARNIPEQEVSWTGPNMAIGHFFLNLLEATSNQLLAEELIEGVIDLTGWLDGFYHEPKGEEGAYVTVGEDSKKATTEYNQRVFAFYYQLYNQFKDSNHKNKTVIENYKGGVGIDELKRRADKIIYWIQNDMWDGDHYRVGYEDFETKKFIPEIIGSFAQDDPRYWQRDAWGYPQYLGPIMAHIAGLNPQDFAGGLDWLLKHVSEVEIDGIIYKGLPRWLGSSSVWGKGTGEAAVTLRLVGRTEEARTFFSTLAALQTNNGGVRAAVGDKTKTWPVNFPYESIEALNPFFMAMGGFDAGFIAEVMIMHRSSTIHGNDL